MQTTNHEDTLTDITIDLSNEDGNAFHLLAVCRIALRRNGHVDLVDQFTREASNGDYTHLLNTIQRYFQVTWGK